jgi:hypothetical protein
MAFLLNGQPLAVDTPFTDAKGNKYPLNWLRLSTAEEKEAIGITEVPDPTPYDQRFYWGPGLPKDHGQLVEQWTQQTRITAGTLLSPTDWMVIRETDNGTVIDPAIKGWRQDLRLACELKISGIAATTTTEQLEAFILSDSYTSWPPDPYAPQPVVKDEVITDGVS